MVIYDYRNIDERIQVAEDLVRGFFDVLDINSTKKMRDSIAINLKDTWYNLGKLSSPDIEDEIIRRMNDLILNNKGDISYKQGGAHPKKERERIIEDVEDALSKDKCFWLTSPRIDNYTKGENLWNWEGYLSWSLVNNNVTITNYNKSKPHEQLLFLHIALGAPSRRTHQSLYFKLLPKYAMTAQIKRPMRNQVMAGYHLKHPPMVNWDIPIKIFFCESHHYNFLNWDDSPFIKQ